jgi:hypothetical protein
VTIGGRILAESDAGAGLILRFDAKALPAFIREAIMKRQVNRGGNRLPIDW